MIFSDENWGGESHREITQAAHKAIIKEYMEANSTFSLLPALRIQ